MDLTDIMLSETSQAEKDKYCMLSLIYGIYKNQIHRNREQIGGYQKWRVAGGGNTQRWSEVQTFSYKINKFWQCLSCTER